MKTRKISIYKKKFFHLSFTFIVDDISVLTLPRRARRGYIQSIYIIPSLCSSNVIGHTACGHVARMLNDDWSLHKKYLVK